MTPHLEGFGAIEVPRARYHRMLRAALAGEGRFHPGDATEHPSPATGTVSV